jgi:hypothetical protein
MEHNKSRIHTGGESLHTTMNPDAIPQRHGENGIIMLSTIIIIIIINTLSRREKERERVKIHNRSLLWFCV